MCTTSLSCSDRQFRTAGPRRLPNTLPLASRDQSPVLALSTRSLSLMMQTIFQRLPVSQEPIPAVWSAGLSLPKPLSTLADEGLSSSQTTSLTKLALSALKKTPSSTDALNLPESSACHASI